MPLYLAVHSFNEVTAKVPFAIILLQDLVTNKKVPAEFKCRQMIPTSGSRSTSLWDVPDPEALLQWLNENVNVDCENAVFEVQEEFSVGVMGEVSRARAAEKVAAGAKELGEKTASVMGRTASAVGQQAQEIDHKLKISERAAATVEAVKESAVARSTVALLGRAGSAVKSATHKITESDRVASATQAIGSGFRKLGNGITQTLSNKGRVNSSYDDAMPLGEDQPPQYARQPVSEYEPPAEQAALRNPSAVAAANGISAPIDAPAAPPAPHAEHAVVEATPASPPPETLAFTLDDSEPTPARP